MIFDAQNLFSDAQALTAAAGTYTSTNVIDRSANSNLGAGNDLHVFVALTAKSGTTPTIYAQFIGADDAGLSTNPVVLATTATLSDPAIPSSLKISIPAFNAGTAGKRYFGIKYITTGTSATFTITAGIVLDEQTTYGV